MSFPERNGSRVTVAGASEFLPDYQPTFFSINFSLGSGCTEISFGSAIYTLVGRWQGGRLVLEEGKKGSKPKRLEEDPSNGHLKIVGLVSRDRIFLHQDLVEGGPEQVEAYCAQLMGKLGENEQG